MRRFSVPAAILLMLLCSAPALAGWGQDLNQGNAAYRQGKANAAITAWERAVADPAMPAKDKANTYYNLGVLYLRLPGSVSQRTAYEKKAIVAFGRAGALDPGMAKAWNNRGNVYRTRGSLSAARNDYTRAIKADPRYAPAWRNRSIIYEKRGKLLQAISDTRAYLRLKPGDSRGKQRLASLEKKLAEQQAKAPKALRLAQAGHKAMQKRQYKQALDYIHQALVLDALSDAATARVYANQGTCWYQLGHFQKAAQSYGRAVGKDPGFAGAYRDRGIALLRLKDYRTASANFSAAINRDPKLASAWYHRGLARWSLGDNARAASDLTRYLQMQPGDQKARQILAKVKAGQKADYR
ncbi:MAG: tetratricopeptide repeat protein [Desulfarculaceae bacterium]|nr:tetratricopeptide repeat protein [Desulfarculaceae bacterium]